MTNLHDYPAQSLASTPSTSSAIGRPLKVMLAIVVLGALAVRVSPLIEGGDRLARQCVSEDGYLMLTIARNVAIGNGFSVADGTVASNGTQPLAAVLYAGCYALVGGDRFQGLYPVVGLQVLVSIACAISLFFLSRKYLYKGPHADVVALVVATAWFASPSSVNYSQNGLETGLCALLILLSIATYDAILPRLKRGLAPGACIGLGIALGLTFLGRNDTCFLIAAMLLIHLYLGYRSGSTGRSFLQTLLIGGVSVIVSVPWLWFNVSRFGHLVPVSGRAEALDVSVGSNFYPAISAMFESLLVVVRIPRAVEENAAFRVVAAIALVTTLLVVLRYRRFLAERFSVGVGVLAAFVVLLFVYYGLFFGMPSFLGRYLFPAVMLSAIVVAGCAVPLFMTMRTRLSRVAGYGIVAISVVLCLGLDARIYKHGREHLHFQCVDWVAENVSEDTWIGAVQTGTLGYYHDRTINLDGKVDPNALQFRIENRIWDYAIQRDVQFIVDWKRIAYWLSLPGFTKHYELLLTDADENLAVLKRFGASVATQTPAGG